MKRSEFIQLSCLACAGMVVTGLALPGCATTGHVTAPMTADRRLVLNKADFVIARKNKTVYRKWVLVRTESLPFPIGVYRESDTAYSAVYLKCTHQGCELQPEGSHLTCPCHGAEFSATGQVQQGPAERDLVAIRLETDQEHLYLFLP